MSAESHTPTANEWKLIIDALSSLFGMVELEIDGFNVTYQRVRASRDTLSIMTYVNGIFIGKWMECKDGQPEHEEGRRFLRLISKRIYKPSAIKGFARIAGKKEAARLEKLRTCIASPEWKSPRSLKKHLLNNNCNIKLVKATEV